MIPRIFEPTEKDFKTLGLGSLSDMLECTVTEERNGDFTLEAEYPTAGVNVDQIKINRVILAAASDGNIQPFDLYDVRRSLKSNSIKLYGRHVSYRLNGMIYLKTTNSYTGAAGLMASFESNVPYDGRQGGSERLNIGFTFGTDVTSSHAFTISENKRIRDILLNDEGSILDVCGGEYEFNMFDVFLHENRGKDNGTSIRYGKNLLELDYEIDQTDHFNGHQPHWGSGSDYVRNNTAYWDASVLPYPYIENWDVTKLYDTKPTSAQLQTLAQSKAGADQDPDINIKVKIADLRNGSEYEAFKELEQINLCDTVHIYDDYDGIYATAKVVKTVYDSLNEKYIDIEIGSIKSTLADKIAGSGSGYR